MLLESSRGRKAVLIIRDASIRTLALDRLSRRYCQQQQESPPVLSKADRDKAADLLLLAEKDRKPVVQLSKTWPDITIEDAYAISSEVTRRKISAGAKLIGQKISLTSKSMQQYSHI